MRGEIIHLFSRSLGLLAQKLGGCGGNFPLASLYAELYEQPQNTPRNTA